MNTEHPKHQHPFVSPKEKTVKSGPSPSPSAPAEGGGPARIEPARMRPPVPVRTGSGGQHSGGKRILIVEDEKPLSHALKLKLSHEGYDVTVAGDGEEGSRAAMTERFDLILIDIIMPKMDGFALLKHLKDSGNTSTIIVLSNLGQQEDIEKAKQFGVKDYMVKSNTPISRIVSVVNTILQS